MHEGWIKNREATLAQYPNKAVSDDESELMRRGILLPNLWLQTVSRLKMFRDDLNQL